MFLLDAPYVSDFLKKSVKELEQAVLDTPEARRLAGDAGLEFIDQIEFSARLGMGQRVLANSENALEHALRCGCNEDLARQIDICKDKALYRETVAPLHPGYRFFRASFDELDELEIDDMPTPFVIKPARGFFSLGVHVVDTPEDWPAVVETIKAEREALNADYPEEVVNAGEFILEQCIEGEEYAIDVYYDEEGSPVVTNILHHHFVSEDDLSDRLYYTSTKIIEDWLVPFTDYLRKMGRECQFRNFVTHVEVRVTQTGEIVPIEANPLRFAGWCVADITHHAWGINPYEHYFKELRPNWDAILEGREGDVYAMVIADVPSGMDRDAIKSFDYDGFTGMFNEVLELRRIDYTEYPVFAFCFSRTDEAGLATLKETLKDDFSRFVETE
ncbi:ATP-grasp domain-containing protein [Pseudodesulfovibrio sp. zrk46]|uniref:ATP-grasp domain-containing protein n=1 Tax=Pseudodesulfovibrio sp. zrk46 TaxID=2725288 RepID=UPI001448DFED|nr:ATP-grasp domain-containing protein [Pseudodesulfovibrio sp. zrk46]QJB55959.1 ATP-grasp domain-containing protein [Pseudodesulfovibrio sp. zrk46]